MPSVPISLEAKIIDEEFAEILGRRQLDIQLHAGSLYKPTKLPRPSKVLVKASAPETVSKSVEVVSSILGDSVPESYAELNDVPIAYKYPLGDGSIVYTAFHNHEQPSEVEESLLKLLVTLPIAESIDSTVKETYASITKGEDKSSPQTRDPSGSGSEPTYNEESPSVIRCSECGTENDPENVFCTNGDCGQKLS